MVCLNNKCDIYSALHESFYSCTLFSFPWRILVLITYLVLFFTNSPVNSAEVVNGIRIEGVINPVSSDYLIKNLKRAQKDQAECLVVEMDTPGGLFESTRDIVKEIYSSPVPVIVYVFPSGSRAASAGVFITLASHVAVMSPGTNIGAAHPVSIGAEMDSAAVMTEKVTNDAVAYIRSIAEKMGRNAEWAEQAVRKSVSVTETEALELNIIDYVIPSIDSLLALLDGLEVETDWGTKTLHTRDARYEMIPMNWREKFLDLLSDPNIAYIFMMIGMYGILFELYSPGTIFPGVVGAICFILAFFAFQTLPISYAGVLLILLGIILFLLEIKIMSYGLLSIGGTVSFILGSLMLIDSPLPYFQLSWKIIMPTAVFTAAFFIFVISMGLRAQRRKPATGKEGLIGEIGVAETDIDPEGEVSIHGEIWKAVADEKIGKGTNIKATAVKHLKLKVKKADQ